MKQLNFLLFLILILSTFAISIPQSSFDSSGPSINIVERGEPVDKIAVNMNIDLLLNDEYHNLSMVYQELERFNATAPEIIDYSFIGKSYHNNSIPLITLTNENIPQEFKGKTYIVAAHHAREYSTTEHVLRLIRDYINEYGLDQEISSLLDNYIIYIIVTLNPDSLDHTLYEDEYHRKTMKPIDDDGDGLFDEDGYDDVDGDGRISRWIYVNIDTKEQSDVVVEGIDNDGDAYYNSTKNCTKDS